MSVASGVNDGTAQDGRTKTPSWQWISSQKIVQAFEGHVLTSNDLWDCDKCRYLQSPNLSCSRTRAYLRVLKKYITDIVDKQPIELRVWVSFQHLLKDSGIGSQWKTKVNIQITVVYFHGNMIIWEALDNDRQAFSMKKESYMLGLTVVLLSRTIKIKILMRNSHWLLSLFLLAFLIW